MFQSNQYQENTGMIAPVSRQYIFSCHLCADASLGYQFITQFCVEDNERAATLVSVTDKSLYTHICTSDRLIAHLQILYALRRMRSFQICRNTPQYPLFCVFSSYTLYSCGGNDDDRS